MNTHTAGRHEPGLYEIRLQGRLHERWLAWFDGMTLVCTSDASPDNTDSEGAGVITVLHCPVADQAALHGVLARLRDVGVPLISVARVEPGATDEAGAAEEGER